MPTPALHFGARCIIDSPRLNAKQKERLAQEISNRVGQRQNARFVSEMELSQDLFLLEDFDDPESGSVTLLQSDQSFFISVLNQMKKQASWLSDVLNIDEEDLTAALDRAAVSVRSDQGERDYHISGLGAFNQPVAEVIQTQVNRFLQNAGSAYSNLVASLKNEQTGDVCLMNGHEGLLVGRLSDPSFLPAINEVQEKHNIPTDSLIQALNRLFDGIVGIRKGSFNRFGPAGETPPES